MPVNVTELRKQREAISESIRRTEKLLKSQSGLAPMEDLAKTLETLHAEEARLSEQIVKLLDEGEDV